MPVQKESLDPVTGEARQRYHTCDKKAESELVTDQTSVTAQNESSQINIVLPELIFRKLTINVINIFQN